MVARPPNNAIKLLQRIQCLINFLFAILEQLRRINLCHDGPGVMEGRDAKSIRIHLVKGHRFEGDQRHLMEQLK